VSTDAAAARVWCVNASDHEVATAWVPAVSRRDDITVAVSAGGDPRRAMALRDAIGAALDDGALPTRRHRRRAHEASRAGHPLHTAPDASAEVPSGSVALVGGGPGDPELITVRGLRLLAHAEVVVTDRLGPRPLLDTLDPEVLVVDVGKLPGHHPMPQDEINRLLVDLAQAGKRVVRLKGGDPYVLGRGGEEALYCRERGVSVEVVPGITSAIAVPAAAGIPVTHRGLSTGFTVVTGHEGLEQAPGGRDHTLVVLMGVSTLATTADALASGTRGPDCPVAIIENGCTPQQRVTVGSLDSIAGQARERGIRSPAVIVIGDVVRLSTHGRVRNSGRNDRRGLAMADVSVSASMQPEL
ncbi:MAG: uroporphyrinogen-III C-methyltransferase, partial [Actinomycetota bacterium]